MGTLNRIIQLRKMEFSHKREAKTGKDTKQRPRIKSKKDIKENSLN
jgi:hypothetical protein